jgi:hypothetical protein
MAASVWMKFSNERVCSLRPSARPFAEITPTVSVFSNWNGLPTAMAQSPLRMRSESPSGMLGSGWVTSIFTRAMSVAGSRPTMRALTVCPPLPFSSAP